jgi:hypothetical protein
MSEFSQFSQQRDFHCPQCNGRIVIPSDLPPTTGPCPHCQATITSPKPVVHAPDIQEDLKPVVENIPTPAPAPIPAQSSPEKIDDNPKEVIEYHAAKKSDKSDKSTKRSNPITLILIFILLLICLGGGAYFVINMLKAKSKTDSPTPINQPTKQSTNPTLQKYLAATTLDEKLNFVYDAEELRPKIEAFYIQHAINETNTPASAFSMIQLPEIDSKKGFILLAYNQPAAVPPNEPGQPPSTSAPTAEHVKILAFLKETEAGVKLDWEVFAQTRYRTFSNFIKTPASGKSEVFRVLITRETEEEVSTAAKPDLSFLISDPIHSSDSVKIDPDPNSQAGQALSRLVLESTKQAGLAQRTATIELTWTGDPKNPKLEIKRFICWEFLGLGGKEIAETQNGN